MRNRPTDKPIDGLYGHREATLPITGNNEKDRKRRQGCLERYFASDKKKDI